MKRTKSIRSKRDPQNPCNVAFREGLEAKGQGLPESACPYAGDNSYATYLRAYWLNGYGSKDGINHHGTQQSL
jgi:ribosome modulation factor